MKINRTTILTYSAFGIALNVVLGTAVSLLNIPLLFLDTVGTVLVAALFGPWWGSLAGVLTNLVLGITIGPTAVFFGLVNVAIAIIVGTIARRFDFTKLPVSLGAGLLIAVIAPLIGTPIAVALFGGLNGSGMDWIVLWARAAGESIYASTFISRITGNLVDKVITCLLVTFLILRLPVLLKLYRSRKETPKHAA
ncbi:CD3073 family putative ECF transporter S component [Robertmurraya korlensis]|uniref:CD3073 family putative ECF transporter S component n=1 Tax=Robertmurraya korlensis TaxID=519977 RepID=UPI0008262DAE|nr:CD3073 family putative ECF transporter S component [Robertmurraya korlensis]